MNDRQPWTPWQRRWHKFISWYSGRKAACGSKINYKSEQTAMKAAEKMQLKTGKVFQHYNCWWCEGWHCGKAHRQPSVR